MFCCDFLHHFEVLCLITKGVYGMQDLYSQSILENKTRSLCDTSARDGFMFSIFHSMPLRSFPVVLFALLYSQELALQLPPISFAIQMREMRVRQNTWVFWVFKVQANLCRNIHFSLKQRTAAIHRMLRKGGRKQSSATSWIYVTT